MPKGSSSYSLDNWYLTFIMLYARKPRQCAFQEQDKAGSALLGNEADFRWCWRT